MSLDSALAYSEFRSGHAVKAYNEAAFRHFLAVDRRRAARSMRSLLLVLVTIRKYRGSPEKLSDDTAAALFRGLAESVREVDFVGWHREGRVAAAVLAQGVKIAGAVRHTVAVRVVRSLRAHLPGEVVSHLRVRVRRLEGRVGS